MDIKKRLLRTNNLSAPTFSPRQIPNMAAWYRYGVGITQAGGFASQWDDQSGNSRHLIQATGTQQPAVQGDSSLLFDGIDDSMAAASWSQGEPVTYFIRANPISFTAADVIADGSLSFTGAIVQRVGTPNIYSTTDNASFVGPQTFTIGVKSSICAQFNGASSLLQVGLAAPSTGSLVADTMGGFRIGARAAGTNSSNVQIYEAIIYNALLSQVDINKVITYLNGI